LQQLPVPFAPQTSLAHSLFAVHAAPAGSPLELLLLLALELLLELEVAELVTEVVVAEVAAELEPDAPPIPLLALDEPTAPPVPLLELDEPTAPPVPLTVVDAAAPPPELEAMLTLDVLVGPVDPASVPELADALPPLPRGWSSPNPSTASQPAPPANTTPSRIAVRAALIGSSP
jgi:hypothetical protein